MRLSPRVVGGQRHYALASVPDAIDSRHDHGDRSTTRHNVEQARLPHHGGLERDPAEREASRRHRGKIRALITAPRILSSDDTRHPNDDHQRTGSQHRASEREAPSKRPRNEVETCRSTDRANEGSKRDPTRAHSKSALPKPGDRLATRHLALLGFGAQRNRVRHEHMIAGPRAAGQHGHKHRIPRATAAEKAWQRRGSSRLVGPEHERKEEQNPGGDENSDHAARNGVLFHDASSRQSTPDTTTPQNPARFCRSPEPRRANSNTDRHLGIPPRLSRVPAPR